MSEDDTHLSRRNVLQTTAGGFLYAGAALAGSTLFATPASAATINVPGDESTIQGAVDAASPGDTIVVDSGTYGESVTVNKNLTIQGDPGDTSVAGVGPNAPTTTEFILEPGASGTGIAGFVLDGADSIDIDLGAGETLSDVSVAYNRTETAEIDVDINGDGAELSNVEFRWNRLLNEDLDLNADSWDDTVISGFYFVNNVFEGSSGDAVDIDVDSCLNVDVSFVINCNQIQDASSDGIEFELDDDPSNSYSITIYNNVIDNAGNEAVEFLDTGGSGLTAVIEYNELTNSGTGVEVDGDGDPTGITVQNNNIVGNTDGIDHEDTQVLDARNNYWGATDGPSGGVTDPVTGATADGSGDDIVSGSESVRFDPFLNTAVTLPDDCTLNDPPTAVFSYSPASPEPHEEVTLDASASTDPDGQIVEYKWDVDGDGQFDIVSGSPQATTSFPTTGDHDVMLVVTDDDGASSAAVFQTISVGTEPIDSLYGEIGPPVDCDGDGRFEDVNGDGNLDSRDIFALRHLLTRHNSDNSWSLTDAQQAMFDFDNDGTFDGDDINLLSRQISAGTACPDE